MQRPPFSHHTTRNTDHRSDIATDTDKKPTNKLAKSIRSRRWNEALEIIRTNPSDCHYRTISGNNSTPLHLACLYRAPVGVIQELLDGHPNAVFLQDTEGFTPLHVALLYGANEETSLLLIRQRRRNDCVSDFQSSEGERGGAASIVSPHIGSPLHVACRHGASSRVLQELICAEPSMVMASNGENGPTPATILWNEYSKVHSNDNVICKLRRGWKTKEEEDDNNDDSLFVVDEHTQELMERMSLILRAASSVVSDDPARQYATAGKVKIKGEGETWRLVHSTVELHRRLRLGHFLHLAILLRQEELIERRERDGRTPLHIAASMPPFSHEAEMMAAAAAHANENGLIEILVRACPSAAKIKDKDGRLPLFLTLESAHAWRTGVRSVLYAAPEALMVRDNWTGLFPFMLASASDHASRMNEEDPVDFARNAQGLWTLETLETSYELLRACPQHVLAGD